MPLAADAQQVPQMPRIGFLCPRLPTGMTRSVEAFRQGLRDLGYLEGQNIIIECRFADDRLERLPSPAAERVRLKVDVTVAAETPAIRPARETTKTVPIIFPVSGDPGATGDAQSLARPRANVTGLSILAPDLGGPGWPPSRPAPGRGSRHLSHVFQDELRFLGIESSPAFVREPEGNGCAEHFIRTLEEQLLWPRAFDTVEELRRAFLEFKHRCNREWLIERPGHQTPAARRAAFTAASTTARSAA